MCFISSEYAGQRTKLSKTLYKKIHLGTFSPILCLLPFSSSGSHLGHDCDEMFFAARAESLTIMFSSLFHLLHFFLHVLFTFQQRAATFTPFFRCVLFLSPLFLFLMGKWDLYAVSLSFALTFPSVFSFVLFSLFSCIRVLHEKPRYRLVYV